MRPEFAGPNVARGVALAAVGAFGGFLAAGGCVAQETQGTAVSAGAGITAVEGLALGHFTLEERPTGCTVVLAEDGAVAGVDVRGGAPGTREIALLDPVNSVQEAHAIVLSGGSAFGLDAASGVVRYLEERGVGYRAGDHVVPIVAAAILFDLGIGGGSVRPGPECGYEAARAASATAPAEGSVGAGAGATVGKLRGRGRAMKGGIGTASITLEDGLTVAAVVAVNAVGDVIDPATGEVVAGVRTEDGTGFADARALLRTGEERPPDDAPGDDGSVENTTIGVVATNARLSKAEITKVAQMAHDGLARAIYPAHTPSDGDTLFGLATGTHEDEAGLARVGALAADMVAEAILRAVRAATGLPGLPSVADLTGSGG
ncbi:MAG: P1 family peptidase [Gemmatimonadales bacterium]|nr:P1 family peptidase [Gemmatimonadales bacterium]MYG47924.1 P1 family peptidase [Gemmatimonadales bacterium]MYK01698.1 P1 family peptidase [Candidatus Palauibacter ramosifaciens]